MTVSLRADHRGVSQTIGYILVFSLIFASIIGVQLAGTDALESGRDAEETQNARRAFDVLSGNVDDIASGNAPSRSTEIKLSDATIKRGEAVTFNVSGEHQSNDDLDFGFNQTTTYDPIVYESGTRTDLVYANGALFTQQDGGSFMFDEPKFVLADEGLVLPLVVTNHRGTGSISGDSIIAVRTASTGRLVRADETTGQWDVTIRVQTARAGAWRTYLSDSPDVDCSGAGNTDTQVVCTMDDVEAVHVVLTSVRVEFN